MSDNIPDLVLAYHVVTREKREVPSHWLEEDGPFPGQWKMAESTIAAVGRETEEQPLTDDEPDPVIPESNVAGDTPLGAEPTPKATSAKSK